MILRPRRPRPGRRTVDRHRLLKRFQCRRHGRAGEPGCRLPIGSLSRTPAGVTPIFEIAGSVATRSEMDPSGAVREVYEIIDGPGIGNRTRMIHLDSPFLTGTLRIRCRCGYANDLDVAALVAIAAAIGN